MNSDEIDVMKKEMMKFISTLDNSERQEFYQTPYDNAMDIFNDLLVFIGNGIIECNPHITKLDEDAKELIHKRNKLVTDFMKKMKLEDK